MWGKKWHSKRHFLDLHAQRIMHTFKCKHWLYIQPYLEGCIDSVDMDIMPQLLVYSIHIFMQTEMDANVSSMEYAQ